MLFLQIKHIFTLCGVISVISAGNQIKGANTCPSETDEGVVWPETETSNCSQSYPICLKENMELLSRCCDSEGNWDKEPICYNYQKSIDSPCPDHSDWRSNICIFVIVDTSYPPQCPYEENLAFSEYISALESKVFPIWMPVRRDVGDYGIDVMRWMEPTPDYKSPYLSVEEEADYYYVETISDKNCLIMHENNSVEAVNCEEKHNAICAYQSLPDRAKSFCSQSFPDSNFCIQSNYSSHSKCFCRGLMKDYSLAPRVEFHETYQNLLYSSLKDTCFIGLQRVNDSYLWVNSNSTIKYSNWAENAEFGEQHVYGAITSNGWIMMESEEDTDCVLYEAEIQASKGEMVLDYSREWLRFILNVTNPNNWLLEDNGSFPLISCFTDAAKDAIISKISVSLLETTDEKASFYFQENHDGPGTYWCEAFSYPDVLAKSSNKYFLRHNEEYTEEYALIVKRTYTEGENPLTESSIKQYQQLMTDRIQLMSGISVYLVRIFKIVDIDEINFEVTINFHLLNQNQSKSLTDYCRIGRYMENSLTDFTYIDLLSVDTCVGLQIQSNPVVTWPATSIGVTTNPRGGFCIGNSNNIVGKKCSGNYIDGAQWLDLSEPCTFQNSINVTVNLTNILNQHNLEEFIEQIVEISMRSMELTMTDIDLIAKYFEKLSRSSDIDINAIARITNHLMEVPSLVLKLSQQFFNATDNILYQLHNILNQSDCFGKLQTENLIVSSYDFKVSKLRTLVVIEIDGYIGIIEVFDTTDWSKILEIDGFKAALSLNENITSMLQDASNSKVIISVYRNSKLFNEMDQTRDTDIVLGINLPYIPDFASEIVTVYNTENSEDFICSFWDYEPNQMVGFWAEAKKTKLNESIVMCHYYEPKHFTLVYDKKENITEQLQKIVNAETPLSEKLEDASVLLSNHHLNVQPIDLSLISDLMEQAADENEDENLELVTDIINMIIDVPEEVLKTSQRTYNATGRILFFFELILQNYSSTHIIKKENIYVIIQILTDDNLFYGFTLDHCDEECNLNLLHQETTAKDVAASTENLNTALLLSQELLNQHLFNEKGYIPKIVTAIFLKKSLFINYYPHNATYSTNVVTKIIGVSFPNFEEEHLEGKLTLLYDFKLSDGLDYTICSVYKNLNDEDTIINGFWNPVLDSELKNDFQTCIFWELKYFALVKNSMDITSTLLQLLQSDDNIFIILNQTDYILQKFYKFFQPIDVYYVAKILNKVQYPNETIFETCMDIINHIMDIDGTVLEHSEVIYKATYMILNALNKIAEQYTDSIKISRNNVVVIVTLLKNIKMYKILFQSCSPKCVINTFYNKDSDLESTIYFPLDAQLSLNPNLITNLNSTIDESDNPRIVLTVFYNNALFIDKNRIKSTTQIFGIHIPHYDSILPHEINLNMLLPTDSSPEDYNCVKWVRLDLSESEGYWSYESKPRTESILNCNFYQQSYFTVTQDNTVVPSVTSLLTGLSQSSTSSISKLYTLQDVSYYYNEFQADDIYLIPTILQQCDELIDNGFDLVTAVIDNILRIPEDILVQSSVTHDALRLILSEINRIANLADLDQNFQVRDRFGLIVCQLKPSTTNAVILTTDGIKCTHEADDISFAHDENVMASLIVGNEIAAQAVAVDENAKMIVSVFFSTTFFNVETMSSSPLILGLSIPSIDDDLDGDVVALFNYAAESSYDCSYWENLEFWKVSDGKIKDLLKRCTYSQATYYSLLEGSYSNVTKILEDILDADSTPLIRLRRTLNIITMYSEQFKAEDVYVMSEILSKIDEVNLPSLRLTANITSSIMNLPKELLAESQDRFAATDWILYYIDRIAEKFDDEEVLIMAENFAIIISSNLAAILVENCGSEFTVTRIPTAANLTGLNMNINVNTVLIVEQSLQTVEDDRSSHITITVSCSNALFNEGHKLPYENVGPIIGVVFPSEEGSHNGSFQSFYYTESKTATVCAFWNYTVENDVITKGHWQRDSEPLQPQMFTCESTHTSHFAMIQVEKNITSDLEDVLNSSSTTNEKLDKVVLIITELAGKLEAVDIYLISKILEIAMRETDVSKMNLTSDIISGLFNVTRKVLRESQTKYSATDKILHAVDEMSKMLTTTGIDPIKRENFTTAIYDLKDSDISGVILENCNGTQCDISPVEGVMNLTEIISNENLQVAILLSEELRNQVRYSGSSAKLVVTIYFSDVLFNEQSERGGKVSMVSGVLLPGFNESFLGNLYVIFSKPSNSKRHSNSSCAFWDFKVLNGDEDVKGSWSSNVIPSSNKYFTVCEYDHITHFALLLGKDDDPFDAANKYNLLDIITAVESVLSVIGLLGILLTAALFERWRRNTGNQILVHFSLAISVKMVMLYVSAGVYINGPFKIACSITGAILHYSILSEFCWMLIIAILQFKRFVEVLGGPPKFVLLKACICGWVFPILPVMLILLIDKDNYSQGQVGLCYPSGLGLYLGIWLPLIIIVSINFVIFIFIIYNVFHKKTETRDLVNHEILFQWRLALLLFSMLGLTWLFGFLSQIPGAENIFVYLFCITATLQGFIMFLFFIVFNKSTRFLYSQSIKFWLYSRGYKQQ